MPLAVSAPVDWLPEVALVPDQPLEAVQVVALVEDQVSVEDAPLATEVGFAASDRVGAGEGEGEGEGAGALAVDSSPPPPQAHIAKASSEASAIVLTAVVGAIIGGDGSALVVGA